MYLPLIFFVGFAAILFGIGLLAGKGVDVAVEEEEEARKRHPRAA